MALLVKKSQLPGAGKGLFTTKAIRKDSKIIEYRGEIIGYNEYRRRARREEDHYLFFLRMDLSIDSLYTPKFKARYANDAAGITRVKGLRNNSDYVIFGDKCFVVASRDIKAGEEIFVNYTSSYWSYMKKRLKKKKLIKS
ncbi:SET domain-containing protein-lysine N-methyltransferase [Sphingobacteriaceae bacterium]|nr:SET domain-containing protein-lysine N-methyltransferase [Sphingobacteriaceae bacterium]